jgi:hypothetical protein
MLRRSRYWSLGRAPKPTLADNMSGFDNRLRVEKARWVLSVCFAREVSCRVRAGEAARPGREYAIGFTPGSRKRPLVLVGGTGGSPASSYVVVVCPNQRMEFGAKGQDGPGRLSTSLGQDRNGSLRSGHVLPTLALLAAANPNSVLNAQEIEAFSQVQTVRYPAVASS